MSNAATEHAGSAVPTSSSGLAPAVANGALPLLACRSVSLAYGGLRALADVDLTVQPGEICAVIGPNGAGKTSLFNCISRISVPSGGAITFDGDSVLSRRPDELAGLGISRTFQQGGIFGELDVLQNVLLGGYAKHSRGMIRSLLARRDVNQQEMALRDRAESVMRDLDLWHLRTLEAGTLDYATQKRVEVARGLVPQPRLLMLDEPAGGLTPADIDSFSDLLRWMRDAYSITILIVEHHVRMVMALADSICVLDHGRLVTQGDPRAVQQHAGVRSAYLGERRPAKGKASGSEAEVTDVP